MLHLEVDYKNWLLNSQPSLAPESFPSQRDQHSDSCRVGGFFETRLNLKRTVRVWGAQGRGQALSRGCEVAR